ncbi:MAG: HlyD family efflux transporter periplasmic adaptor subunit [Desulfobulbaceae bacterium]|nr:HlyD family efflux transporter periplasmic adaptor subunit [Desulfobulbaceae bacterium]
MIANADSQAIALSILVQVSRRVREAATTEEIGFIAVNESKQLLDYRQAVLWMRGRGVVTVSGIPDPDRSSPYVQWLMECCKHWQSLEATTCSSPEDFPSEPAVSWQEWAPYNAVIAPLRFKGDEKLGLLIFFREEPWHEQELAMLNELASIYTHGFLAHGRQTRFFNKIHTNKWTVGIRIGLLALAVASLFYPVRMSVHAPAEVVPKDPFVVRSPLDTVIDKFHVLPNQAVAAGQLLFEFDRTNLGSKYEVANKAYQVAAEEYRQAAQTALVDDRSRAEITPRRGRMEEKASELSYTLQLLKKTEVRAPRSGIAVFAEQSDWVGKGVSIGERVLTIADPNHVELLIRLPVADAIYFDLNNPVRLYLTSDPQNPLDGTLRYAAYKPETTSAGIAFYRLKADFSATAKPPRIGLTGTARIYGKKAPLGYYLFRRPLTALRQRFGW